MRAPSRSTPPTPSRLAPFALVAALLTVRAAPTAEACGGSLPGQALGVPTRMLLGATEVRFADAAREIAGRPGAALPPTPDRDDVERRELYADLVARGITGSRGVGVLAALVVARTTIALGGRLGPLPPEMPREFALYLEAAAGDWPTRGKKARELLALPEAERRHRTVWAAYLLYRKGDTDRDWGAETRRLAAAGFPDPLRLAAATFSRERKRAEDAVTYATARLDALAAGDDDETQPLLEWARDMLEVPDLLELGQVARHARPRALLSARLLAVPMDARTEKTEAQEAIWLQVLADLRPPPGRRIDGAELIAALAYRRGDLVATRRWLALADPARPLAARLHAKLALRAGRLPAAEPLLARAAEAPGDRAFTILTDDMEVFREEEPSSPGVELGIVQLARGKSQAALETFLALPDWMSAAYVAERVLTIAELRAFVDGLPALAREPTCAGAARSDDDGGDRDPAPRFCYGFGDAGSGEVLSTRRRHAARGAKATTELQELDLWRLRFLLARRLIRQGDFATARRYMPALGVPILDAYAAALAAGRDPKRPLAERGAALARAARLLRRFGMELVGTELAPDWRVWEGNASGDDVAPARLATPAAQGGAGTAERTRLAEPFPTQRFHYRWLAADLAWEAGQLLPPGSEAQAQILCFGGQWIIMRDQASAGRFWRKFAAESSATAVFARSSVVFEGCLGPGEVPVTP